MDARPSILCPIDFSDASAGALRYAAAVASRFATRLIVLTVEDPLLTEAVDLGTGVIWTPDECTREMAEFAARTFGPESSTLGLIEYDVAVGAPAMEILRVARERSCALIVMSTHGLTGMRKLFFGSTTERVLRETTTPILVTPAHGDVVHGDDVARMIRRILVPVDLSAASLHTVQIARRAAEELRVPLILAHVIEPMKTRLAARLHLTGIEADRRALAEEALEDLLATIPRRLDPEALLAYGDPAEELAKVARDRRADLIVMGLHGSPRLAPRMGSVTYRLLCISPAAVLALPPQERGGVVADVSAAASTVTSR
jgi:nucleotide-binding universal stress UspA family protein